MSALQDPNQTESFSQKQHGASPSSSDCSHMPTTAQTGETFSSGPPMVNLAASSKNPLEMFHPAIDISSFPRSVTTSAVAASMGALSSSTPSHSPNSNPSPRPAVFDSAASIQRVADYCAELKVLMDSDGTGGNANGGGNAIHIMGSDTSPSNSSFGTHHSVEDERANIGNTNDSGTDQTYRHGQIGAFKHFPRFDQASRPIVSDNWRAKSAAETTRPQLTSLTTGSALSAASPYPQHPRSPFMYTPTRSPLPAPANSAIAGFNQLSPKPPPTPVSLSTPVSMAFPGRGYGHGHAHHLSTGSLGTSIHSFSPTSTPNGTVDLVSPSTDALATQLNNLSLRGENVRNSGYGGADGNNLQGVNGAQAQAASTTALAVTVAADTLGYCFVRPNGTRTRLVPVDMLPFQLQGIPTQESGNERLVALPVPGGVGGDGRSSNLQLLRAVVSFGLVVCGGDGCADSVLVSPGWKWWWW